jgi:hypothetical protein
VRFNRRVASDYRFAPALIVRLAGAVLVALGVLVVLVAVLVTALDLSGTVLAVTVVAAALLVVVVAGVAARGTRLVHFDDNGYQVRLLRGAGVKRARWREVEDAVTANVSGHNCVVLRLRDGRTTTIPVEVLDTEPAAFVADLTSHLDRGHGYRRIT